LYITSWVCNFVIFIRSQRILRRNLIDKRKKFYLIHFKVAHLTRSVSYFFDHRKCFLYPLKHFPIQLEFFIFHLIFIWKHRWNSLFLISLKSFVSLLPKSVTGKILRPSEGSLNCTFLMYQTSWILCIKLREFFS